MLRSTIHLPPIEEGEFLLCYVKNEECNEIQGFLYYRPMCIGDFETVMHMQKAI